MRAMGALGATLLHDLLCNIVAWISMTSIHMPSIHALTIHMPSIHALVVHALVVHALTNATQIIHAQMEATLTILGPAPPRRPQTKNKKMERANSRPRSISNLPHPSLANPRYPDKFFFKFLIGVS